MSLRGCFPMPPVRMPQHRNQLVVGYLTRQRPRRSKKRVGNNSINAPSILATREIQMILDDRRQTERMLDNLAIHIQHIQSAIGPIAKLGWAETKCRLTARIRFFASARSAVSVMPSFRSTFR